MNKCKWFIVLFALFSTTCADAHVGSPDVYADGQAGPYRLSIVLRPPRVIPGVAEIEVRAETPGINHITITPLPLTGEAAKHPPVPDTMVNPSKDPQFFTGHLWIMATGSWQVRFVVDGAQGHGELSIPLPATAMATSKMNAGLGSLLAVLGLLLLVGMVGIVGAAASKAELHTDASDTNLDIRRGRRAMAATAVVLLVLLLLGDRWWTADAAKYAGNIYKPLQMTATLQQGNVLNLKTHDSGWLQQRSLDDLILDHNHLMHLYMIRWPEMDVVFHLHPQPSGTGDFQLALPSMPAGDYHLYADVVHADGFPETLVSGVVLQQINGRTLSGDDAEGVDKPMDSDSATKSLAVGDEQRFKLPDGYIMVWKMPSALTPKAPEKFRFELLNPAGEPPGDMAFYMGMLGHAAFIKSDGTVFAHIHPSGTMAMATYMMANPQVSMPNAMRMSSMPNMDMNDAGLPNVVTFPYGFPSPGRYRIFVQMKHGTTVETGIFDANVLASAQSQVSG
ncbi:MAG TPA: hypothetical protein VGE93_22625 [Bryobacteraceae bacterium]